MMIHSIIREFIKNNSDNWNAYKDYDEKGNEFYSINSTKLEGNKSATINTEMIKKLHIESNVLCIALNGGMMVWFGGDTGTFSIDTTDYNNPMLK